MINLLRGSQCDRTFVFVSGSW